MSQLLPQVPSSATAHAALVQTPYAKTIAPSMAECFKLDAHVMHEKFPFAEVRGVDLKVVAQMYESQTGDCNLTQTLRRLIEVHGCLLFRNQTLSPKDLSLVNQAFEYHDKDLIHEGRFGFDIWDHQNPLGDAAYPEVQVQGRVNGWPSLQAGTGFTKEGFHADGLHDTQTKLPVLTSMFCHKACRKGGETLLKDSRAAFNSLSEDLKTQARSLQVHYLKDLLYGSNLLKDPEHPLCLPDGINRNLFPDKDDCCEDVLRAKAAGGTVHSLVHQHCDTGDESINLNCCNICYMESEDKTTFLNTRESYALVNSILGETETFAHRWTPGDFLIWDNRITLHAGPDLDDCEGDRLTSRVRFAGKY